VKAEENVSNDPFYTVTRVKVELIVLLANDRHDSHRLFFLSRNVSSQVEIKFRGTRNLDLVKKCGHSYKHGVQRSGKVSC
jgi:hypothetical protein